MSLYKSIEGVKKEAKELYAGIDGVKKEISTMYSGRDGVKETVFSKTGINFVAVSGSKILYSNNGLTWGIYAPTNLPSGINLKFVVNYKMGDNNIWGIVGETGSAPYKNHYYLELDETLPSQIIWTNITIGTSSSIALVDVRAIDNVGIMIYFSQPDNDIYSDGTYAVFLNPSKNIKHRYFTQTSARTTYITRGLDFEGEFFAIRPAGAQSAILSKSLSTTTDSAPFSSSNISSFTAIKNLATGHTTTRPTFSDGKTTYSTTYIGYGLGKKNYVGGRYSFPTGVNQYTNYGGGIKIFSSSPSLVGVTYFYYPTSGRRMYVLHSNSNGIFYTLKTSASSLVGDFYFNEASLNFPAVKITALENLGFFPLDIAETSSKVIASGANGKIAVASAPLSPSSEWTVVSTGLLASEHITSVAALS